MYGAAEVGTILNLDINKNKDFYRVLVKVIKNQLKSKFYQIKINFLEIIKLGK